MIEVGLIGFGLAGRAFHAPVISAAPGLHLAAILQRSGNEAAEKYPDVRIVRSLDELLAIKEIRQQANQIATLVTAMHPIVAKLDDPPTQSELLRALFQLTSQVEVVKKHLLKWEKRDDSALL